jgi:GT2 family glycosyltransferase
MKVQLIVATRVSGEDFWLKTATGQSLKLYQSPHIEVNLFASNSKGLPEVYNSAIDRFKNENSLLIFAHDDLHILDFFWMNTIYNGLLNFGIVGVAGSKTRAPFQPTWAFADKSFKWQPQEHLSGVVGHGNTFPPTSLNFFGPPFEEVKLLDGLILAAFSETLIKNNIRFDERFMFHFYDLDFCRQAEALGIKMGTVPLSIIHESHGGYGSEGWHSAYDDYLQKWGQ